MTQINSVSVPIQDNMQLANQGQFFREFSAGADANVFKVNEEGVFIGGTSFSSAPIRFTYTGVQKLGGNNIQIDGPNKRIIVNDGTNDRVLIGYYPGLF